MTTPPQGEHEPNPEAHPADGRTGAWPSDDPNATRPAPAWEPPRPGPGSEYGQPTPPPGTPFYGPPGQRPTSGYGQPFPGPPGSAGRPPPDGSPGYGQPYGNPRYGAQPYGPPGQTYGPPSYGQQAPYGYQPYGAAAYGQPAGAPARTSKAPLIAAAVAGLLLLVVGAVALALTLQTTVLDRTAVERDVATQFEEREGVALYLDCAEEMEVAEGATYECTGVTDQGEEVTLQIAITDETDAAYTWGAP
ncbi:MAG: hypothetical protein JWP33_863 [Blastococcus sp.]|jgi:hypothetical protein|nr:hypothetical protein [Blastococcus sp.]